MSGETMKQVCGVCGRMFDAPEQRWAASDEACGIFHRCAECTRSAEVILDLVAVDEDLAAVIRRIEGIRRLLAGVKVVL